MIPKVYDRWLARQSVVSWIYVFVGSVVLSAGFVLFMNPYRIVPGGVYGAGIVLHYLFPSVQGRDVRPDARHPAVAGWDESIRAGVRGENDFSALLIPLSMNAMTWLFGESPETLFGGAMNLSQDMFLPCIFGGVLIGAGTGLIIKSHATSGGTDIIAKLLTRYAHIRFSRGILIVDSCVVLFGMIVLGDWRLPLYSLVTIFVSSRVIDYILDGASYDKLLFIVSDRREQIREYILERMGRGGTYLKASGMYTAQDKEVIFVVVSRGEVSMVRSMVHEIDPTAFVVIVDADETYGDGFKPFPQKE